MPKSGSRRKKTRTHVDDPKKMEELENAPKSFILKRGKVGLYMKELLKNMRELMYPYTAMKLKESKKKFTERFSWSSRIIWSFTYDGNDLNRKRKLFETNKKSKRSNNMLENLTIQSFKGCVKLSTG